MINTLLKNSLNLALKKSPFQLYSSSMKYFFAQKVLLSDPIDPICRQTFEKHGWEVEELSESPSQEELIKILPQYNALVVRSGTRVNGEVLEEVSKQSGNLEYIGRAGTGVDNICIKEASKHGIVVMNTPGGNTISTAEHTMAMILALSRNVSQGTISLQNQEWKRKDFQGTELYGKTVGIVGMGNIGKTIAKWFQAFSMRVICYDPVMSDESLKKIGTEPVPLKTLLNQSDYITLHTPLNQQTRNLINKDSLKLCKNGVKIINCARGGIVNEEDLLEGLNSGKVGGAGLDVFTSEPPEKNLLPLINHPNVVVTPHLGASTEEAQIRVAKNIAEQIVNAQQNKGIVGGVNIPKGFEFTQDPQKSPYINLADRLGHLQGSFMKPQDKLKKIIISYHGPFLKSFSNILTCSVIQGYLNMYEQGKQEPVNLMNAQQKAQEKGLEIVEKFKSEHYITTNAISLKIIRDGGNQEKERLVVGSCYGLQNKEPHLVQIGGLDVRVNLSGNILFVYSKDRPGALNTSLEIIENHNHIENMFIGRRMNELAICSFHLEDQLSTPLMRELNLNQDLQKIQQVVYQN